MRLILAFAVVLLAASLTGQVEHAPTVAQCRADQRLWRSQLDKDASSLKYAALRTMAEEMIACDTVDPPNHQDYYDAATIASTNIVIRMSAFMQRHQLWHEFLAEDAAGKR
jgi:hypothetical protein